MADQALVCKIPLLARRTFGLKDEQAKRGARRRVSCLQTKRVTIWYIACFNSFRHGMNMRVF